MNNKIVINTDGARQPEAGNDLHESRSNYLKSSNAEEKFEATVAVVGFNRLEKTKECVESLLKYTTDVRYKLVLVDNGSSDGTLEYFEKVDCPDKLIISITKNIGSSYPTRHVLQHFEGDYIVFLANDLIVTSNWLSNLIKCAKSDYKIGLVQPVSSNVSNNQQVNLEYSNRLQMQEEAKKYNVSDPRKWHERVRIITLGNLITRECLTTLGSLFDAGFFHDFVDDDLAFRIRRAGYKVILAKDTWIHHNHNFREYEDKNKELYIENLRNGKYNFSQKYYGIDAWEDTNNFEYSMISMIKAPKRARIINVLGIDVKCGTPILEIKNKLRGFGIFNTRLSAYPQDAKYFLDLKTICEGVVKCDRIDYLSSNFMSERFDYIMLGNPINLYREPYKLLQDIINLSGSEGQIIIKLRNTFDYKTLVNILGQKQVYDENSGLHISLEELNKWIVEMGYTICELKGESDINPDNGDYLRGIVKRVIDSKDEDAVYNNIAVKDYIISITKTNK